MESSPPLLETSPPLRAGPRRQWGALFALCAAIQFLTIAPPLVRRSFSPREMGRAVGFFPLVGLALGCVLLGLNEILHRIWPASVTAGLVLLAWVLASGALHFDGLLDSCDGVLGGRTPEERLRIMKDERVGAFAVVAGTLYLLIKYLALSSLVDPTEALLLAPMLGRWAMALAIVFFPYARAEGLGRWMKDHAGWHEVALACLIAGPICWWLAEERGIIAMALAACASLLGARVVMSRLSGLTGDIYGAICEIVEALVLLVFAARIYA